MKYNKIQSNIKEKLISLLFFNENNDGINNENNKYLLFMNFRKRPYLINNNEIHIYIKSLGNNVYITITKNNKMIYCKSMGKIGIHKKERKRMKSINLFSKILIHDIFKKLKLKYQINKMFIYWSGPLDIISPFIRKIKNQLFFSMKKMKKRFKKFMKARFRLKFLSKKKIKKNTKKNTKKNIKKITMKNIKKNKISKIKYLENLEKKYKYKLQNKIRNTLFKSKYKLKYWYKSKLKEKLKNKFFKIKNLSFKLKKLKKKIKKNKKIKKSLFNFRNKVQFILWKLKNHPNLFLYKKKNLKKKLNKKNKRRYILKKLKKIFSDKKIIRLISYSNIRKYPYNGCKGRYLKT